MPAMALFVGALFLFPAQSAGGMTLENIDLSGETTVGQFRVVYNVVLEVGEDAVTGSGTVLFYANDRLVFEATAEFTASWDGTTLTNIQVYCEVKGKEISFLIPGRLPGIELPLPG